MEDSTTNAGGRNPRKTPAKKTPPAHTAPASGSAKKTSAATAIARKSAATTSVSPALLKPAKQTTPPAKPTKAPTAGVAAPPTGTATEQPRPATEPPRVATEPRPATSQAPKTPLWNRIVADPGYAAEHLVREAVHRLGPEARDWIVRARLRYPGARPDGLARLAAKDFARASRRHGAASGAAGLLGSLAAVGVLAHLQARLVLTIAAAYGVDPTSEERARDLIELLRVPRLNQPSFAMARNAGELIGGLAASRVAARLMPFGAAVAGAVRGARSTETVAARATAHYRSITGS